MLSTNIIKAVISTMITAIVVRFICEGKCRTKSSISTPHSSTDSYEQSLQNAAGPLNEEMELTTKDLPLNCSQNVAYKSTSKK